MGLASVRRNDSSLFGQWFWTLDWTQFFLLVSLLAAGLILVAFGSPSVAERIGLAPTHFVFRHLFFVVPAALVLVLTSMLPPRLVTLGAAILLVIFVPVLLATLVIGVETKGARRWISIAGFSLQPSEFMKPALIIISAWLMSRRGGHPLLTGKVGASLLCLVIVAVLLMQPDVGMAVVVLGVLCTQLFVAGLPMLLVVCVILGMGASAIGAYSLLPHVRSRVDRFLDPSSGDTYQIDQSVAAFREGGLFGLGLGQGNVKMRIPDVHADFIFAVAAEEMGLIGAALVLSAFAFIVMRFFLLSIRARNLFAMLAVSGLAMQLGLQGLVNAGSTMGLLPTKGMTFPFLSYGGSSLVALAFAAGAALSLSRRSSLSRQDASCD